VLCPLSYRGWGYSAEPTPFLRYTFPRAPARNRTWVSSSVGWRRVRWTTKAFLAVDREGVEPSCAGRRPIYQPQLNTPPPGTTELNGLTLPNCPGADFWSPVSADWSSRRQVRSQTVRNPRTDRGTPDLSGRCSTIELVADGGFGSNFKGTFRQACGSPGTSFLPSQRSATRSPAV
jgi:hypothetical protein